MSDLADILRSAEEAAESGLLSPKAIALAEVVLKKTLDAAVAAVERSSGPVLGAIEAGPLEWVEGKLSDAVDAYLEAWAARLRARLGTPPLDHLANPVTVLQDQMLAFNAELASERAEYVKEKNREE